ncbi:hypothetical protein KY361_02240 [Candidatus Woesearchaeota archaeon]|nr:hypothetical protein [Candidatus Woesearchaeota archaeon]
MAGPKYRGMDYLRPEIESAFDATLAKAIQTEDPSKYRPTPLNKDRPFLFEFNGSLSLDMVIRDTLTKIKGALSKGQANGLEDIPESLKKQISDAGDIGNKDLLRLVIEGYRCRVHYEVPVGYSTRGEELLLEVPLQPHIQQLCEIQRDGEEGKLDAVPYEVANDGRNGSEYPIGRFLGLNIGRGSSKTLSKLCEWFGLEPNKAQNNLVYQFVVYVRIGEYAKDSKRPDDPARTRIILGTEHSSYSAGNGDKPLNLADIKQDEDWDLGKSLLEDTQRITNPTASETPTPPANPTANGAATVDPGAETNYAASPATKPTSTRRHDSTRTTRFELNPDSSKTPPSTRKPSSTRITRRFERTPDDKPRTSTEIKIPKGKTSRWESFQLGT